MGVEDSSKGMDDWDGDGDVKRFERQRCGGVLRKESPRFGGRGRSGMREHHEMLLLLYILKLQWGLFIYKYSNITWSELFGGKNQKRGLIR